jgi:hypothetical protein
MCRVHHEYREDMTCGPGHFQAITCHDRTKLADNMQELHVDSLQLLVVQ